MMDDRDLQGVERRRKAIGPLLPLLLLLAFAGGIALAAFAVHRWDRVAGLVRPSAAAQTATAPAPLPVTGGAPSLLPLAAPVVAAADPALAGRVEALDERMAAVDARARAASGDANRAEGLLVAFAARRAIDRGQPLGFLEGLLHAHFGGEPQAVAMVIGAAQRPVTLLRLQDRLAALAPALAVAGPEESWWAGVRRELGGLFVVRHAQTPSGAPGERQSRADRALEQGQVEVALGEVVRMPGSARAADWIAEARRYVLAHNALDRIETAALLPPSG